MRQILMLVRHAIAILVLPYMVVRVVPHWLINGYGVMTEWRSNGFQLFGHVAGGLFF